MSPSRTSFGYAASYVPWLRAHASDYDAVIVNGLWQYLGLGAWRALHDSRVPYYVFTHGMLAGQTHAWVGDSLGVGFYRAGGYAVGFVFRPDRAGIDDRVQLPKIRGQLVSAHATLGSDRAWLWLTCADAGRLVTTCIVIGADAEVLATETLTDAAWLAGIDGACAAGPYLFVPTDDGIARKFVFPAGTTIYG